MKSERMDYVQTPVHTQLEESDTFSDIPDETFIGMNESCVEETTDSWLAKTLAKHAD